MPIQDILALIKWYTSGPSLACEWPAHFDTDIVNATPGSPILYHAHFASDDAYYDACKSTCGDQPECKGFFR